jgi:hypothetical protein
MRIIFKIILLSLCLLHVNPIFADESNRKFDEKKIEKFKKDKSFEYNTEKSVIELWWIRFKKRLSNWLESIFDIKTDSQIDWTDVLLYIMIIAGVILFIYAVFKGNFSNFIFSAPKRPLAAWSEETEDIHGINYELAIDEALDKQNYRLAIRLEYQKSLKILSDNEIIDWRPEKTNRNYIYEISDNEIRKDLSELTKVFEKTWYGEYYATFSTYENVKILTSKFLKISKIPVR